MLGLDVGSKTIGIAVSDDLGIAAHPLMTLARVGTKGDVTVLERLVASERAVAVVVGLPLTLDGEIRLRARRVMVLVDALKARLAVPVETWDERFSTAAAMRVLIEADLSRARRKEVIDRQAATYILQGWLDARQGAR